VKVNNAIVVPYGRGRHLTAIRLGGSGDVTDTHRMWTRDVFGGFVPTPAVHEGKVYVLSDKGKVTCVDPDTGETHWEAALPKDASPYYASPVIADGKLYATREDGTVLVATITGKFEVLSENVMGEQIISSPIPLGNSLLLRGETHLFCVGAPAN
jgi:outer membrane protein assembly factor BamB